MNSVQLRVPRQLWPRLSAEMSRRRPHEGVVFGLVSHASVNGRSLVLVRDLVVPPESAFLPSNGHGARWSGAFSIELLNRAMEKNLGIFIFHSHGGGRKVRLSEGDLSSAGELLPRYQMMAPDRPHGSVVFASESVDGVVALPNRDALTRALSVQCIRDGRLCTWPLPEASDDEYEEFRLRPVADSPLIRKIIKASVVAVVGLSGGGSQVIPHLAAMGVGEIIGIDPQAADSSNRVATPQVGWIDAKLRIAKTTSARWRVRFINPLTRFTGIKASIPDPTALAAIKRADIVIGSVNNYHARADINEIAWRYCIPYIDIGLRVATHAQEGQPDRMARQRGIPGQRFTALPGGPCLWCAGFLTEQKLRDETGDRGRSYLQGSSDGDALVSCFNGVLAAEAAAEALRLLSGTGGDREARLQYDGEEGTLEAMIVRSKAECALCTDVLAAGDPLWIPIRRGD